MKKLLLFLGILFVGCSAKKNEHPEGQGWATVQGNEGSATVFKIQKDGVTCFVLVGYQKGAIDCLDGQYP